MKSRVSKYIFAIFLLIFLAGTMIIYGDIGGKTGRTLKTSTAGCGSCHGSSATSDVMVLISGPDTVNVGQTNQYTLTISKPLKTGAGLDIAKRLGTLAPVSSGIHISNAELVQNSNVPMSNGTVSVQFSYTAPSNSSIDTIWATGLATNSNGGSSGDNWNWAPSKKIVVKLPVSIKNISLAKEFNLSQNYPNPFNPETSIKVDVLKTMYITVKILDILGNEVSTIQNGKIEQGEHILRWNAGSYPSGVYFYKVEGREISSAADIQKFVLIKKMLLVK